MAEPFLSAWHRIVATRDAAALDALIADDAVFRSPVVHTPQRGKALTLGYLRAALAVLNNGTFRYAGEWHAPNSAVLEFACELDGTSVEGVDIVRWNDAQQIVDFKVMLRPMRALTAVMERMRDELAAAAPH